MRFIVVLMFSCLFAQELEVTGDLKVTGSIQNDSLMQIIADLQDQIADLQAQLAAMQGSNKLETRIFQITDLDNGQFVNLLTNSNPTLPILDFYLSIFRLTCMHLYT